MYMHVFTHTLNHTVYMHCTHTCIHTKCIYTYTQKMDSLRSCCRRLLSCLRPQEASSTAIQNDGQQRRRVGDGDYVAVNTT